MKLGFLQCNLCSNDIKGNSEILLKALRTAASQGAELCISSELALCGCPASDFLLRRSFLESCAETMRGLAETLRDEQLPPLLLGAPLANPVPRGKPMHNCAVLLKDGKVSVVARKVLLVADGIHNDPFYFEPGVACGVLQMNGWRFAVTIGEDMWNDRGFWHGRRQFESDPVEDLMSGGADAIINLTAIPYAVGGPETHGRVLAWAASKYRVPVLAVNQVGGMDSSIYPGGSMAYNSDGGLFAKASMFAEEVLLVDLQDKEEPLTAASTDTVEELWRALVLGVRDFVHKCGFHKALLGLSGGIDSALVAALAAEALGAENVTGILMPSPYSSKGSVDDSLALAAQLGMKTHTVPIAPAMQAFEGMLKDLFAGKQPDTTEENLQARLRSNILMAYSNKFNCILLNTGNKSEAAMGYSTLYGDMSGALAVIGDLYKRQVYELSNWLNQAQGREVIPRAIIEKEPSAELRPDQKDSDSLPAYSELDAILSSHLEEGLDKAELLQAGFAEKNVTQALRLLRRAEFKRQQAPPALHVSRFAFGQRGRMPVATTFNSNI